MQKPGTEGMHPGWWTLIFVIATIGAVVATSVLFSGSFRAYVPVTLISDRAGLVMDRGAEVRMRGVQVGRVGQVTGTTHQVSLKLEIDPHQTEYIPANVQARIRAGTLFSGKFVELVYPSDPSPDPLAAGTVITSQHVSTEINTLWKNLAGVLDQIDPVKLQGVFAALAEGVRGHGIAMGQAISDANQVLIAVNSRADVIRADLRAAQRASESYSVAAQDILSALDAVSTTSATVVDNSQALDVLLVNVASMSRSGIDLLGSSREDLIDSVTLLETTTRLLMKYNPTFTCTLVGAKTALDSGYLAATGAANGKSMILDSALLLGADPYRYPRNLPIIGAKGGPGGEPGCGSLPDVAADWPVRQLITNTGWGTGLDIRPNPGIAFPGYANFFPVTRAVPEPPSIRNPGGPAPGPIPYPGAPAYGAQLYAPDGTPLWPGLPPAPLPGAPREPGPTPGSEPFVVPAPAQLQPTPAPAP